MESNERGRMSVSGRYVIAVGDIAPTVAAREWAAAHAVASHAPLTTVHVDTTHADDHAAPPVHTPADDRTVLFGAPPEALAKFVHDGDVLVIGTDKTGFIHARVFGSLGIRIVAAVRSSVAVIPHVDLRFRSGIVAGIDHRDTAALIARIAAAEAAARNEPLQLLHSTFAGRARHEGDGQVVLDIAAATAQGSFPSVVVHVRTTARPPAEALLDASRNAALLVLGPGGKSYRSPIGSVLHDVLVNINSPVLVVRPAESALAVA